MHLSEFVRTLRSSVLVVFNNFLLIDARARSKISSDQKRFLWHQAYTTSHFSRTLPLTNDNLKKERITQYSSVNNYERTNN